MGTGKGTRLGLTRSKTRGAMTPVLPALRRGSPAQICALVSPACGQPGQHCHCGTATAAAPQPLSLPDAAPGPAGGPRDGLPPRWQGVNQGTPLGTEGTREGQGRREGRQWEKQCRARDAAGHGCWSQGIHAQVRPRHRRPRPFPVISLANWAHQHQDPAICSTQRPPVRRPQSRAVPGSSAAQQVTCSLPHL